MAWWTIGTFVDEEAYRELAKLAATLSAALAIPIWFYCIKKNNNWQGWRWRVIPGGQRVLHGGRFLINVLILALVKKIPWKPLAIWGPWIVIVVCALFFGLENWRGARAWEKTRNELLMRGETLDLTDFEPAPLIAGENLVMHPAFRDEVNRVHSPALSGFWELVEPPRGRRGRRRSAHRRPLGDEVDEIDHSRAVRADLRGWWTPRHEGTERQAALDLLAILEPHLPRLEAIAQAAELPGYREHWNCNQPNPYACDREPGARTLRQLQRMFRSSALARSRAGDPQGAMNDVRVCARLTRHATKAKTSMGYYLAMVGVRQLEGLLWELVQDPGIDLDRLSEELALFGDYDGCVALMEVFRFERAEFLAAAKHLRKNRQELAEWYGWQTWMIPSGWFRNWQARYCELTDRAIFRPDGVDAQRVTPETIDRIGAEEKEINFLQLPLLSVWVSERSVHQALHCQTVLNLMRTGLQLERFKRDHGHYPRGLNELVPHYLAKQPVDVMTGDPLIYRIKNDGSPLVYSVGANRIDDGGCSARDSERLDWVWQLTPTEGQSWFDWHWGAKSD